MKKHLILGLIAGGIVTAASVILTVPTDGVELVEELELEEEILEEKIKNRKSK